jgi:CBS domain-containing protein
LLSLNGKGPNANNMLKENLAHLYQRIKQVLTLRFSFFPNHQEKREIMTLTAKSSAYEIMVPADKLIAAHMNAKFSEVFFKINGMGVSYIPVFDDDDDCVRILSRLDLVKCVPPAQIPEEVAAEYGINRGKIVRSIATLGNKKISDLFPSKQDIVSVKPLDSLEVVIQKLTDKYEIGDKPRYISGLPVFLNGSRTLEGFISFRDVFQYFIATQQDFLEIAMRDVATLPVDYDEVIRMTDDDDLSYADSLLQTGIRSIPIVTGPKGTDKYASRELWGFVDEIKVNIYKHEEFTNNLATLQCKHFAVEAKTLVRRGHIISPDDSLAECLPKFWVREEGQIPPAAFVVAEKKHEKNDKYDLLGVVSYIDILRAWKRWNAKIA